MCFLWERYQSVRCVQLGGEGNLSHSLFALEHHVPDTEWPRAIIGITPTRRGTKGEDNMAGTRTYSSLVAPQSSG